MKSLVTMLSSGSGKSISRGPLIDCCTFVSFILISFGEVILGIRDMVQRRRSRAYDGKESQSFLLLLVFLLQYVCACSYRRGWRVGDSPRCVRKVVKMMLVMTVSRFCTLHATEATNTALLAGSFSLHLLGDLDVDLEELADATIEADGLALVKVTLAVAVGNTLLGAGFDETVKYVSTRSWCD